MMRGKKIYNRHGYGATPIVLVLIPLVLLGGYLLFSYMRNAHAPEIKAIATKERSPQDDLSIDSDQDGLKDWEEEIYGTNPHNPDTDADGIKDGDEIAQGRDPLKPGPDDYLTKKDISSPSTTSINNTDRPNLTQKLAEVFGTDYLTNLVQNPESQLDVDAIADKMTQIALDQPLSQPTPITAKDIIVSHDTTKTNMIRYLKEFNAAMLNPLRPLPDTESISKIIMNIIQTSDTTLSSTAVDQLAKKIDAYNQFFIDVKTISVPEDFVSLHVDYLNNIMRDRDALKKIKNTKKDPMMILVGLKEFKETRAEFYNLRSKYIDLTFRPIASTTHQ